MKRTNCQTDEIEVERKKVKIKGKSKPQEIRTKKVVCDLVEESTEEPEQICINKEAFNTILDRIQDLIEQPITEESHRERLTRVFGSIWDDQIALSKAIAEKKKPKKKNCTKGNTWHKKSDGTLTNKSNAGSWSLQYASKDKDCAGKKKGVARVSGGKELFVKGAKCGRSDRSVKCGTKSESMISEELILRWKELIQN
jgi:hypothetical protein